jgi:tRNA modification GTPase
VLVGDQDTIVAQATATGRGAIAIIRLSGARAYDMARALGVPTTLTPRRATLVTLREAPREAQGDHVIHHVIDRALVTWFPAPHSYTGDDVVEFAVHGGPVTTTRVVAACVAVGARPALPGEFTRRAVVNGRMNLMQAEAVADIIDARSTAEQQQALQQLDGGLSRRVLALREQVLQLEALLAYDIDFPEEDDGPIAPARITTAAVQLRDALAALLRTVPRGGLVRDGALVVLAGPPNAGKSSLFNALLGQSRAIVTSIPGTTRDAIEALLDRRPLPLRLVDTAGLRDTDDVVEQLGIEMSQRYLREAQVVLACGENPRDVQHCVEVVNARTQGAVLAVHTKCDLVRSSAEGMHAVSAERGDGLAELLEAIDAALDTQAAGHEVDSVLVTRERHRVALTRAHEDVASFLDAWTSQTLPAPVAAAHLLAARETLSELIGVIDTDDVLDVVFRDFCIGK